MSALIDSLRDPRCYPHPVDSVRLIETHISWLLLTGTHAYKIKKPLTLDFLDFGTLELRRHYCEEELRLNRRFAPGIYLEVVPISDGPGHPLVAGAGEPIEYAVKMREFAQACLFDQRLAAGVLTADDIDALGDTCARLHAEAAVALATSPFGTPASLLPPALENFATLERLVRDDAARDAIARLRAWTESEHARLAPAFALRKADGRIRECHGDLHLGNIALIDGAPMLFDCIEFNDAFRWIDVMSEMAFTVMDLHARGRGDLGQRLLNRYLQASGDYEGVRVLRFYLVYRAAVRAKIECIRLVQAAAAPLADGPERDASERDAPEGNGPERDGPARDGSGHDRFGRAASVPGGPMDAESGQDVERRLDLARRFARGERPFLAITCGLSGSGKTYASGAALERTRAIRVRSDVERKRLARLDPAARSGSQLDAGLYSRETSDRTFTRLAGLARTIIEAGYPVIVDASFIERERREPFKALAAALGVPFLILHCHAPDEVLSARIVDRRNAGADASEADLDVLRMQQKRVQAVHPAECSELIEIDTVDPASIAAMADRLARLSDAD